MEGFGQWNSKQRWRLLRRRSLLNDARSRATLAITTWHLRNDSEHTFSATLHVKPFIKEAKRIFKTKRKSFTLSLMGYKGSKPRHCPWAP